jgi:N4-gp56 family major capsid protein
MPSIPTPAGGAVAPGQPPAGAGQRSLNADQHAGSGPDLTSSGVAGGVNTRLDPMTDLALGAKAGTVTGAGSIIDDLAVIGQSFDKVIRWRNRLNPNYRRFVNVRAIREAAFPGSKVTVFRTGANGLPLATTALSEYADPDAKSLKGLEDKLDVTVDEYGDSTVVTQRLQRFSWTQINPMQVEAVRRQMTDSVDAIYMNAIYSTSGGFLGGGFRQAEVTGAGASQAVALTGNGTMAEDKLFLDAGNHGLIAASKRGGAASAGTGLSALEAAGIRRIVGHFRSLGVTPFGDGTYMAFITPDASIHLRETTDLAGWRYPHLEENANGNIWNGTVGVFEGVRFVEGPGYRGLDKGGTVSPTTNNIINVAPTKAYDNLLFLGAEGITDVIVEEPHAVITPTTDRFGRLFGMGWIGCFGASVYENNAGLLVAVKRGL